MDVLKSYYFIRQVWHFVNFSYYIKLEIDIQTKNCVLVQLCFGIEHFSQ